MIEGNWLKLSPTMVLPRDRQMLLGSSNNGMWRFQCCYILPNATVQAIMAEGHTHVAVLPAWIPDGPKPVGNGVPLMHVSV